MEASVDLSSPKKRPAYKKMWEDQCKISEDWSTIASNFGQDREDAEQVARDQIKRADRWATAAVIEAVALVAVALILWLR